MKAIRSITTALALVHATAAFGGEITEIWTAEVVGTSHTAAATVGSTLSWTVTYDNTSETMIQYADGSDGKANTADDVINNLWDINNPTYSSFDYFSNAVFDFGTIFTTMEQLVIDSSVPFRDAYNFNQKLMYANTERTYHEFIGDYKDIILYDFHDPNVADQGRFNVYYYGPQHTPESIRIDVSNVTRTTAVSEPGGLLLLMSGLLLLLRRGSSSNRRLQLV